MKQRLLLCLLMLMVSVGIAIGQTVTYPINVIIPEGNGTVKFKIESDAFPFDVNSWPKLAIDNTTTNPDAWGKSLAWTIKQKEDDKINLSLPTIIDESKNWGNLSIVIEGEVSTLYVRDLTSKYDPAGVIAAAPMLSKIKKIELKGGTVLSSLKLGKDATKTDYFENLETLIIPENKLNFLPTKTDKMTPSIGKITTTDVSLTDNARSFMLDATELFASKLTQLKDVPSPNLSIKTLYKGGATTSEVKATKVESIYHFKDANGVYVDGEYTADIEITDGDWKGIVIGGVTLNVEPAQFTLNITGKDATKVSVKVDPEKTSYEKGNKITLTPTQAEGSAFAGFELVKGLEKADNYEEGNSYVYVFNGKDDAEIKVLSKAANAKVTFNTNTTEENGTLTVWYNNAKVTNGTSIPCGAEIKIIAEAKTESFTIDDVKMGTTSIKDKNTVKNDPMRFEATVTVPNVADGETVNITATFVGNGKKLTIDRPTGDAWNNDNGNGFTITDNSGKDYVDGGLLEMTIPVNTELTITMKPKAANKYVTVQINGTAYEVEEVGERTYVVHFKMPNADSKVIVTLNDYKDLKEFVELKENEFEYDNTKHKVELVVKSGKFVESEVLNSITIEYAKENSDTYVKEDNAFSEVGKYQVRLSRPEGDGYAELKNCILTYEITKTDLYITKQPKVSVVDGKYVFTDGMVGYKQGDKFVDVKDIDAVGSFAVWNETTSQATTDEIANQDVVVVIFQVKDSEENFNSASGTGKGVRIAIEGADVESIPVYRYVANDNLSSSLIIKNGASVLSDGAKVPEEVKVTFEIKDEDPNCKYAVYLVDETGNRVSNTGDYLSTGFEIGSIDLSAYYFELVSEDNRTALALELTVKDNLVYTGKPQTDVATFSWKKKETGDDLSDTNLNSSEYLVVTYKEKVSGKYVEAPVNAGDYEMTVSRKASPTYQELSPVTVTVHIAQAELDLDEVDLPMPTASRISKNQLLSKSILTGTPSILGKYVWAEDDKPISATSKHLVDFVPEDGNYLPVEDIHSVEVVVTDKAIITYSVPDGLGTITVRDNAGNTYETGEEIMNGVQLTVTATPNDASKVEFESLKLNNGTVSNPYTFTFGDNTVDFVATFKPKSTTVIVPDGQYEIDLPDAVRGAMISYVGDPIVDRGEDFTFTVTTLATDADKLKVTANGLTLKRAANGSYTISDVTEKQTVRISFSSTPTEVKVDIPLVYHEEGHATQGEVSIINNTSGDGKYFYGDELTLIAFPESGVTFEGWSDKSKQQVRELTLTGNVSLRALFSGSPTGIEDIEAARIVAGDGYIQVKNVASANVTVVSMAGRIQTQQRISGDAQIRVPAGIYVVILENGQDVKRTKVIVR